MSNSKEILLIVEDEESLAEGLIYNFQAEGFTVEWEKNGLDALRFISQNHEHIVSIILDIMLPQINGYEILEKTRLFAERIPILVLSAKNMESDKIKIFEMGADDFVSKPFNLKELILRVKKLVQKRTWYTLNQISVKKKFGSCSFDENKLTLEKNNGEIIRISPTEGFLIQIFLEQEGNILTRPDLLKRVWNYEITTETRTVDVFISKLRKYIEENPAKPKYLVSIRGMGYMYNCPV